MRGGGVVTDMLPFLSLAITAIALIYSIKTYTAHNRPYVGIVDVSTEFEGTPPKTMTMTFEIKNVGSLPATAKIEEISGRITDGEIVKVLPNMLENSPDVIIMPGQISHVHSRYSDSGASSTIVNLIADRATLDATIRLSYKTSGSWWGHNHYKASFRFKNLYGKATFFPYSGEAD